MPHIHFSPIDQKTLKKQTRTFIEQFGGGHEFTFVFNRSLNFLDARKMIGNWLHRVDRHFLGRNFQRHEADRTNFVGFFEHETSNIHCHAAGRLPGGRCLDLTDFCTYAEPAWEAICYGGDLRVWPIEERIERYAAYITKEREPEMLLASEFWYCK